MPSAGAAVAGGTGLLWAFEGAEVMVKPPGLLIPGTKTSSHWPGRNCSSRTGASDVVLSTSWAQRGECVGWPDCFEEERPVFDRCDMSPTRHFLKHDAGGLTLMLPMDGGMVRRKVRMEGLTSSMCLRMTVWSDC